MLGQLSCLCLYPVFAGFLDGNDLVFGEAGQIQTVSLDTHVLRTDTHIHTMGAPRCRATYDALRFNKTCSFFSLHFELDVPIKAFRAKLVRLRIGTECKNRGVVVATAQIAMPRLNRSHTQTKHRHRVNRGCSFRRTSANRGCSFRRNNGSADAMALAIDIPFQSVFISCTNDEKRTNWANNFGPIARVNGWQLRSPTKCFRMTGSFHQANEVRLCFQPSVGCNLWWYHQQRIIELYNFFGTC